MELPKNIEQKILELEKEINLLRKENIELKQENAYLKAQLNKDSHNSSKPPSSDGFKKEPKPNPKSLREKSDRKSGGQKGHKGYKLCRRENPDHVILHDIDYCEHCGKNLKAAKVLKIKKRQEFDIPAPAIYVTEHQVVVRECPACKKHAEGKFPEGLVQEAQYGNRLKAFITYLNQYHHLPYERIGQFMEDVFGQKISEGSIKNILNNCYEALSSTEEKIKEALLKSELLHSDETGIRVSKKLNWQHVLSTDNLTYYAINEKRGSTAIEEMEILPKYKGTIMHDHFNSYFKYGSGHALCNAHHLRELTFIEEVYEQNWAKHMKMLLLAIKKQKEWYQGNGGKCFPQIRIDTYERCYDSIIMNGLWHKDNLRSPPTIKSKKQSKAKNLLDRLRYKKKEVLAFMCDFNIPFDNNLAERDLRMSKVKQKISGCFRSKIGAKYFCRIRSYISTARKNGISILTALDKALLGEPFIPNLICA